MQSAGSLCRYGSRFRRALLALVMVLAAPASIGRAADLACDANDYEQKLPGHRGEFLTLRNKIIKDRPPVAAQSMTRFLTAGGDSEMVFRAPATADKQTVRFRVFETNGVEQKTFESVRELPVLAVAPAPEKRVTGFLPADSTLIRFQLPDREGRFWAHRSVVVVRCIAGNVADWGLLRARASDPQATLAICAAVLALAYLLGMYSVRRVHKETHPLAAKYPSYQTNYQIGRKQFFNPIYLTSDVFQRGNVQKLQVLIFSFLVGGLLLSLVLRTGVLVTLSVTIVALLGISGVGAVVAQSSATARNRMSFDNWAWLVKKGVLPINEATEAGPRWRDLVTTNREFDVYKLQTVIFTIAVAFALLAAGASSLESFTVPEALLGILGLSQVVYVAGILVRPPAVDDLDKAITELRKAEETAKLAVAHNIDVDVNGSLPPLNAPPPNVPFPIRRATAKNALRRYKDLADRVELMIESTLETAIDRARLDPDIRENRRTLGPEGGPHGTVFSIEPVDDEFEIDSLTVWAGAVIDAIQITYRHRATGELAVTPKIGGGGGGENQLVLEPGEYITRVEGRAGACVVSMSIQTNRRRVPAGNTRWGGELGDRGYDFICRAGEEIIGFEGRSGDYIDAIGAIVRTRR
jgi:hypothetical protein